MIKKNMITQDYLAQTIDVSKNTLYGWISKERYPDVLSACKIAQTLHTTTDFLVFGTLPESTHEKEVIKELLLTAISKLEKL